MAKDSPEQEKQSAITGQPSSESGNGASVSTVRWRLATRIGFRFCFAYLLLFTLGSQIVQLLLIEIIPKVRIPEFDRLWPMRQITLWTAAHFFHVTATLHPTGSGDTAFDWVETFCIMLFAVFATAVWSLLDRRRENYATLHKWFRVFLRFALAAQMFIYGFEKVIPQQMLFPPLLKLVEPFGNFSPMAVLWNSVGAAPAYEIFTGSVEVLGGLLLILPITTMLGALICAADMTLIFALNMAYDVPVKILSFHLLLIALFLLAPDVRRLIGIFFTYRAAPARSEPKLFRSTRAVRIALACQILLGVYLAGFTLRREIHSWSQWGGGSPKPALYGIWSVEQMTIDGQLHPPLLTDAQRWHRIFFGSYGSNGVQIEYMNQNLLFLRSSQKASNLDLRDVGPLPVLGYPGHPGLSGDFAMVRPTPNELILDGSMGGHHIHAEMKRVDLRQFTLISRGFHWVTEYPFQR